MGGEGAELLDLEGDARGHISQSQLGGALLLWSGLATVARRARRVEERRL